MGWVVDVRPRPVYPRKRAAVPMVEEVRWAPSPVWTDVEKKHTVVPPVQ